MEKKHSTGTSYCSGTERDIQDLCIVYNAGSSILERIKNIKEQITLAGLLPGVKLGCLPPEESANLTRAVLDLYKLGYTRGFKAGADLDDVTPPRRDALEEQWLKRGLLARMREYWQGFKKSLRSIRATIIRKARRKPHRRFPTETLSSNWVIRR